MSGPAGDSEISAPITIKTKRKDVEWSNRSSGCNGFLRF